MQCSGTYFSMQGRTNTGWCCYHCSESRSLSQWEPYLLCPVADNFERFAIKIYICHTQKLNQIFDGYPPSITIAKGMRTLSYCIKGKPITTRHVFVRSAYCRLGIFIRNSERGIHALELAFHMLHIAIQTIEHANRILDLAADGVQPAIYGMRLAIQA